jgi:hypothetical protein
MIILILRFLINFCFENKLCANEERMYSPPQQDDGVDILQNQGLVLEMIIRSAGDYF